LLAIEFRRGARWLPSSATSAKKVYSQNDEDGVLEYLCEVLGTKRRFFVEIGVGPAWTPTGHLSIEDAGLECNCRLLRERGWGGVLIDGSSYPERFRVVQEFVTVENINALFAKYAVPKDLDFSRSTSTATTTGSGRRSTTSRASF